MNDAGEELRGVKGRLKRPSPVGTERWFFASKTGFG
jgi:hypothetical protein